MPIDVEATFKKNDDEFLKFELIDRPLHRRPDICAFLLLDKLCPPTTAKDDIIGGASHDEIWLDIDMDQLAEVASEEDIITLSRCGVHYDGETDSLAMFV